MLIRQLLLAIFMLSLVAGLVRDGIQRGDLMGALPSFVVALLIIAFVMWREWKVATDAHFAASQAKIDSLPWEQAISAAASFFGGCIMLLVPLMAIANLHPQTFHVIDFEMTWVLSLLAAGAIIVGMVRLLWLR
jgi:hypothetical protein